MEQVINGKNCGYHDCKKFGQLMQPAQFFQANQEQSIGGILFNSD
jgi:hypothetical protein